MDRKRLFEIGKVLYQSDLPFRVRLFMSWHRLGVSSAFVMEFFRI